MRSLALASALTLAIGATALVPAQAESNHKTMKVELANGKTVTFKMVRIHGRMMAVISARELEAFMHGS